MFHSLETSPTKKPMQGIAFYSVAFAAINICTLKEPVRQPTTRTKNPPGHASPVLPNSPHPSPPAPPPHRSCRGPSLAGLARSPVHRHRPRGLTEGSAPLSVRYE